MIQKDNNVLFDHIPKTGGITMRIILNRVYGPETVFTINSTDIGQSLESFSSFTPDQRKKYSVIAGHGASLFTHLMEDPFRLTILREPVSLFLSQYYFLKISRGTNFFEEVRTLNSIEDYLDYAIRMGQDNLLTRYLSHSIGFLADRELPVPDMKVEGDRLLELATKNLFDYDAVIDLANFDSGVYVLASKLGWPHIPVYRPSNRNKSKPGKEGLTGASRGRLYEVLKYDLTLFETFKKNRIGVENQVNRNAFPFFIFKIRQRGINATAKLLGKN